MRSLLENLDQADTAARQAHAARIAAIGALLGEGVAAPCLVSMVSARCQVSAKTARAWVREATDLRRLPHLAEAAGRGALSGDQVGALRVLAEPGSDGVWVETLASELGREEYRINDLERMARRKTAEALERSDGGRYFTMKPTKDERFVRGRFQLHPEEAAALEQQLDARVPEGTRLHELPAAHADALTMLVADADGGAGGTRKTKATVVVRTDPLVLDGASDAPGELCNGTFVPAEVVRAMASDGRVIELNLTRVNLDTKQIPEAVRRWVYHRDGGRCRAPDCSTPTLMLEEHHIVPRSQGGSHHPSNVVLLCWCDHQVKIHRDGWKIIGNAEQRLVWVRPDGGVYVPPPIVKRARSPDTS